ncbi:plasmid pRiA4b ORF-3 family protein [Haloferula sp. A504]|uniref:plasmid pRiA4b ORF-3 family protein n=1 Tax=Haloferula sp. A504 TaxID=3373601 RepID=UPI0031C0AEA4|nr:plasmid pRiA4b ORF-3 family protein [Verrucomicrobiaceae bacterium E54]
MIFDLPLPHAPDSDGEPVVAALPDPLLEQLFAAAAETLKARPWEKLHDTDWFVIVDPDTGATHIVAIMGAARQFYAVQVYLPDEGIRFWNDFIHNGAPNTQLGQYRQRMVSCEFVAFNTDDLDETDMDRNDTFVDPDFEPDHLDSFLFRATHPGCVNWHPDESEARWILDALRLVPRFLKQWKKLPHKCYQHEPGDLMPWIPCYRLPENKDRARAADWELTTIRFPEVDAPDTYLTDELFPARLDAFPIQKDETWQIGNNYFGKAVFIGGRPTWLMLHAIASETTGFALGAQLLPCTEPIEVGLRKCLLKAASETGHLPATLKVRSPLADKVFSGIPRLKTALQDDLPQLDEVLGGLTHQHDLLAEDHPLNQLSEEALEKFDAIMAGLPSPDQVTPKELTDLMERIAQVEGGGDFLQGVLGNLGAAHQDSTPGKAGKLDDHPDLFAHTALVQGPKPGKSKLAKRGTGDTGERFIFRIDLERIRPPIWRRLSIPTDATFEDLHFAIQVLFDWDDDHLHSFMKRQARRLIHSIGPDPENDELPEDRTPLKDIFTRKGTKLHYIYDFGDNWTHLIQLEDKVKSQPGESGPACLAGRGIAPPEDCGGIRGFMDLLNPDSGYAEDIGWEPEEIQRLREGKFDPKSIRFR